MKIGILSIFTLLYSSSLIASSNNCLSKVAHYNVVKDSVFAFEVDKKKACFFAFYLNKKDYSKNNHDDNFSGNSMWYGYYMKEKPSQIIEFPKPSDSLWEGVCHINAVSFYDMNGDNVRDVSVIGSCNNITGLNYTYPFVFIRKNNRYIFDENTYRNLYGFINLSVNDLRKYIAKPDKYYVILRNRYKSPTFVAKNQ